MGEVHQLVLGLGREEARKRQPEEIKLIDIAAALLSEESLDSSYVFSGFCVTSLPHKKLPDDAVWERIGMSGRAKLVVAPGVLASTSTKSKLIGCPYGALARLMLIFIQSEAVKGSAPIVELGRSMHDWLGRMGVACGGRTYNDAREQARRLAACSLSYAYEDENGRESFENCRLIRRGSLTFDAGDGRQGSLPLPETVELSSEFFTAVMKRPVPLWEPALRELSNQSQALDIYVWLAYRLHVLERPTPISWAALFEQFGAGYAPESAHIFRRNFIASLKLALAAYPDGKVELQEGKRGRGGIVLHHSRPAIPKLNVGRK